MGDEMSEDKTPINIMLDLETLGIKPGCKILSISAVTFNTGLSMNRSSFDATVMVSLQDQLKTDPNTLEWWNKQSKEAYDAVFNNPKAIRLTSALESFEEWLTVFYDFGYIPTLWGNGASFDCPVLAEAYRVYGYKVPWHYRNERCYRTLLAQFGHLINKQEFEGVKHNSLADATYQANVAEHIFNALTVLKVL